MAGVMERLQKTFQYAKEVTLHYKEEANAYLWETTAELQASLKSQVLALICLTGIMCSFPITITMVSIAWIVGQVNSKKVNPLIKETERKTVLITGASSTKGIF